GYATMGELVAWIIGWDLILEYAMGAAGVAVGWSGHFASLLDAFGLHMPAALAQAPFQWCTPANVQAAVAGCVHAGWNSTGAFINLPAMVVSALMTWVLVIGIKESANLNNLIVVLKVLIIVVVVGWGVMHLTRANWTPYVPPNTGVWGEFGWSGVLRGAGLVFFAYIGFDAVSTAAQEAKNPQRDLPIGILGSLAVCTLLYVVVSAVLTGMVSYTELNVPAPMALAMQRTGAPNWLRIAIDVGAVLGLASVVLVQMLGQSRVFYAMSRDGLIGGAFSKVHARYRTPYLSTLFTGAAVALASGLLPLQILGQLVNIGTLLAFALVCLGVLILRRKRPDLDRPFKVPFTPLIPVLGVVACVGLMATLPLDTWLRLGIWLAIGMTIYFTYGRSNSVLQRERQRAGAAGAP
ncbi:MAG TPA: amino acid permease, partial [Gemmatimonadales bacterium]|nr:amino acid permease [Gemmatimonadales bacterium]